MFTGTTSAQFPKHFIQRSTFLLSLSWPSLFSLFFLLLSGGGVVTQRTQKYYFFRKVLTVDFYYISFSRKTNIEVKNRATH